VAHNCLPLAIVGFARLHLLVPRGLYRSHHSGSPHFITFTCYHRYPHLSDPTVRDLFVQALERTRVLYRMRVYAFVVMPEHVHLLISEPERGTLMQCSRSRFPRPSEGGEPTRCPILPFPSGKDAIMIATSGTTRSSSRSGSIFIATR